MIAVAMAASSSWLTAMYRSRPTHSPWSASPSSAPFLAPPRLPLQIRMGLGALTMLLQDGSKQEDASPGTPTPAAEQVISNELDELDLKVRKYLPGGHANLEGLQDKKLKGQLAGREKLYGQSTAKTEEHTGINFGEMDDRTDLFKDDKKQNISSPVESNYAANIQLTDGWYSLDTFLDASLSKQLAEGKLFIGQKLRICGAGLCGWAGPISPLAVHIIFVLASKTVSLLMHINGTYQAHWAASLGLLLHCGTMCLGLCHQHQNMLQRAIDIFCVCSLKVTRSFKVRFLLPLCQLTLYELQVESQQQS